MCKSTKAIECEACMQAVDKLLTIEKVREYERLRLSRSIFESYSVSSKKIKKYWLIWHNFWGKSSTLYTLCYLHLQCMIS